MTVDTKCSLVCQKYNLDADTDIFIATKDRNAVNAWCTTNCKKRKVFIGEGMLKNSGNFFTASENFITLSMKLRTS